MTRLTAWFRQWEPLIALGLFLMGVLALLAAGIVWLLPVQP